MYMYIGDWIEYLTFKMEVFFQKLCLYTISEKNIKNEFSEWWVLKCFNLFLS